MKDIKQLRRLYYKGRFPRTVCLQCKAFFLFPDPTDGKIILHGSLSLCPGKIYSVGGEHDQMEERIHRGYFIVKDKFQFPGLSLSIDIFRSVHLKGHRLRTAPGGQDGKHRSKCHHAKQKPPHSGTAEQCKDESKAHGQQIVSDFPESNILAQLSRYFSHTQSLLSISPEQEPAPAPVLSQNLRTGYFRAKAAVCAPDRKVPDT